MLDDVIIGEILEREKKRRKDSSWQPIPLYKEIEAPRRVPSQKEKSPSGPVEIDIWGPQNDDNVVQTSSYNILHYFQ